MTCRGSPNVVRAQNLACDDRSYQAQVGEWVGERGSETGWKGVREGALSRKLPLPVA